MRALVEPVDRSAVLADPSHGPARRSTAVVVVGTLLGAVLGAFALSLVAVTIGLVLTLITQWVYSALDVTPSFALVPWLTVPVAVGICAFLVVGVRRGTARRRERSFRLSRFAAANGLDFTPETRDLDQPGSIFRIGVGGVVRDVLRTRGPHPVEIGSYTSQENSTRGGSHSWDYLAFPLDRTHPHSSSSDGAPEARAGPWPRAARCARSTSRSGAGSTTASASSAPAPRRTSPGRSCPSRSSCPCSVRPSRPRSSRTASTCTAGAPWSPSTPRRGSGSCDWSRRSRAPCATGTHGVTEATHEPPGPLPSPRRGDDRWVVRTLLLYPVAATVAILVAALLARG